MPLKSFLIGKFYLVSFKKVKAINQFNTETTRSTYFYFPLVGVLALSHAV